MTRIHAHMLSESSQAHSAAPTHDHIHIGTRTNGQIRRTAAAPAHIHAHLSAYDSRSTSSIAGRAAQRARSPLDGRATPRRSAPPHRAASSTRALAAAAAARRWPRPFLPHREEWPCAPGRARPRAHEPHGHLSWRSSGPDSGRLRPWRGARALREARCAKAHTWARLP